MDKLVSDRAQAEISKKVLDIVRNYFIVTWQSEPHHEHQNPCKKRYCFRQISAPASTWLLALLYVTYILNHLSTRSLDGQTPLSVLTGQTTDISALLLFFFWEPVYFPTGDSLSYTHKPGFPSDTTERLGRFVGFGESVGDALTFKIFTDNTQKIMYRSSICTAQFEEEWEDIGKQADRNIRA